MTMTLILLGNNYRGNLGRAKVGSTGERGKITTEDTEGAESGQKLEAPFGGAEVRLVSLKPRGFGHPVRRGGARGVTGTSAWWSEVGSGWPSPSEGFPVRGVAEGRAAGGACRQGGRPPSDCLI